MLTIVRNDYYFIRFDKHKIKICIETVLDYLKLSDYELSISFESNNKLRNLKKTYLGINETTDVLSFKSGDLNPESGQIFLGDILISPKKALQNAKEKKHSLEIEILFLCIHGLLHLLDFDHATVADEKRMFDLQNELLKQVTKL